jgi:hypothetical protein
VNVRAGEGARRGAARSPAEAALSLARVGKKEAPGEGGNELGFHGESRGRGFLFGLNARAAVHRHPTVEIVPRVTGLLLAQAGTRI